MPPDDQPYAAGPQADGIPDRWTRIDAEHGSGPADVPSVGHSRVDVRSPAGGRPRRVFVDPQRTFSTQLGIGDLLDAAVPPTATQEPA